MIEEQKSKVAFVAQFPPPYHGLSIAVDVLYTSPLAQKYHFQQVDLTHNRDFPITLVKLLRSQSDLYYFTISQSVGGNLRDLLIMTILAAKRRRIVIHLHGGYYRRLYAEKFGPLQKWANRLFFGRADRAIVNGNSLRNMFEGVISDDRIDVVHNFVAVDSLADDRQFQAKVANLKAKPSLTVLYLSNFNREKGWLEVLQLADLTRENKSINYVFAGKFYDSANEELFFRFVKEHRLEGAVTHRGVVYGQEKADLLLHSDVFILPTRYPREGQPISIIEAMGNGLAIVCTPHSGIPDTVTDGVNGFFREQNDIAGMKAALDQLLGDRELFARMAVANRNRVLQAFSQERYLSAMEAVFDRVLG